MGFWEDFAKGFNPAYLSSFQQEEKQRHEKEILGTRTEESRRDKLLGVAGEVAKSRAKRTGQTTEYLNAVPALEARLKDEEGNLIPGAETLLRNPRTAHEVLNRINTIEEAAAKDDNTYTPPLYGQTILDNFTVYDRSGQREPMTDVNMEDLVIGIKEGDYSDRAEYEQEMQRLYGLVPSESETPAPVVQTNPELMRNPDPARLEEGREAYKQILLRRLSEDLAASEGDETRFYDLKQLQEDLNKNGLEGQAVHTLNDMYGASAMQELMSTAKGTPYIQNVQQDPQLRVPLNNYYINRLREVIEDPNTSEERKSYARKQLKQRFGVTP